MLYGTLAFQSELRLKIGDTNEYQNPGLQSKALCGPSSKPNEPEDDPDH